MCYLFAFGFVFFAASQNRIIDSLTARLKAAPSDTEKVTLLNGLAWEYNSKGNYPEALAYVEKSMKLASGIGYTRGMIRAHIHGGVIRMNQGDYAKAIAGYSEALRLAEQLGDPGLMAKAYSNLGIVYISQGDYAKAKDMLFKSLKIDEASGNKRDLNKCYTNLGIIYEYQSDFPKALEYYFKGLRLIEELGDKRSLMRCFINIGIVYSTQGNLPQALAYYEKGLKLAQELGDKLGVSKAYYNMGNVYVKQKAYPEALSYFTQALKINKEIGNESGIMKCYMSIGDLYEREKNYLKALEYYSESMKMAEELGEKDQLARIYNNIGGVFTSMKEYKKGKDYLEKSLLLCKEIDSPDDLRIAYDNLAANSYSSGNYKEAYEYHVRYTGVTDSIFNSESTKELSDIKTNFEVEKKAAELKAEQDKKDAVQLEEANTQKIIRNSFIAGAALLLGLAFLIYKNLRQSNKTNRIITEQKQEVEKQKHEAEHQKELVEEKQKEIVDSINYAKRIQYALLAHGEFLNQNLASHFVLFRPKDIVSGDFFWATKKEGRFYLAVCDSTGHGVPGAFMSLLNISFLNEAINERNIVKPDEVLNYVREKLINEISQDGAQDGMDGVLICIENGALSYAAAHNGPVIIRKGSVMELPADKMPVGKGIKTIPFTNHRAELMPGDVLYLYTDGYPDQFGGPKGKKFKHRNLLTLFTSISTLPLSEQKQELELRLNEWKGNLEQVDDVCIVGVRF